jgi:hypothetical protein
MGKSISREYHHPTDPLGLGPLGQRDRQFPPTSSASAKWRQLRAGDPAKDPAAAEGLVPSRRLKPRQIASAG